MNNINIDKHFPYDEPREQQVAAINEGMQCLYDDDKKFFILDAGTGIGKSAIGITLASLLDDKMPANIDYQAGTYVLTTQKILQQQYMKDFRRRPYNLLNLMSSTNYTCTSNKSNSCSEGQKRLKIDDKDTPMYKNCKYNCVYKRAKENFIGGKYGITNFSYFMMETSYVGKLIPRDVLIIDEAHNIENELSKFIEVSISEAFVTKTLKKNFPDARTQLQAYTWIKDEYFPELKIHFAIMETKIEKLIGNRQRLEQFEKLAKQVDIISGHISKIERFLKVYSRDNWVFSDIPKYERQSRKFEFKPIDISPFTHDLLFKHGRKVILMSATILDGNAFRESLGIDEEDLTYISIPSPFPIKNRPVYYCPIGKMNAKEINTTLPKLVEGVKLILEQHKNDKGVIHCHTYKIARYLKKNIQSRRLLIHDSLNRDEILDKHLYSIKPTVLLSPSMTEGVDFKGKLSRFQVLCKIPYPYLGDKLVKKRMYKWKWWYPLQTTKRIIQSVGRSIRNENDHAVTYILDQDWDRFYSKNKKYFPSSFNEALKK